MSDKEQENLSPWQRQHQAYLESQREAMIAAGEDPDAVDEVVEEVDDDAIDSAETEVDEAEIEAGDDEDEVVDDEETAEQEASLSMSERIAQARAKAAERLAEMQGHRSDKPSMVPLFKRALGWLIVLGLCFLGSLYVTLGVSRVGKVSITGNKMVNAYTVLESSDLKVRDYALSVALHKGQYERAAAKASKIIESTKLTYQFPNDFKLAVKEYQPVAYIMTNKKYVTVYGNGYFDMAVTLPEDKIDKALFTIEKLTTPADVKALLTAIKTLKPDISSLITKVTLDPTEATKDMVDIDMSDGNQVRVPLSQIEMKMPYYTSVASQLTVDSVVDMEAGIYAKSKQAYADELKQKAEEKKKAEEEAAKKKAEEEANGGETSDESSSSEASENAE